MEKSWEVATPQIQLLKKQKTKKNNVALLYYCNAVLKWTFATSYTSWIVDY